jgi:hypothetical protein
VSFIGVVVSLFRAKNPLGPNISGLDRPEKAQIGPPATSMKDMLRTSARMRLTLQWRASARHRW